MAAHARRRRAGRRERHGCASTARAVRPRATLDDAMRWARYKTVVTVAAVVVLAALVAGAHRAADETPSPAPKNGTITDSSCIHGAFRPPDAARGRRPTRPAPQSPRRAARRGRYG